MPPRRHTRSPALTYQEEIPEVCRLWLLRLLVPLGAQRKFINRHDFASDKLAQVLGLGRWIDDESESWDLSEDQGHEIDEDEDADDASHRTFNASRVRSELRRLHQAAERKSESLNLPLALRTNLDRLAALVGLSAIDVRILEFSVMLHSDSLLAETAEWLDELSTVKLIRTLSVLLDLSEDQVREALATQAVLSRTGLVTCERQGANTLANKLELLSDHFADTIMSGEMDPVDLLRQNVSPCPPAQLSLGDYAHIEPSLSVLQPYLTQAMEQHRKGVNIFVYGAPGTGKTQLSRALATALGCELFQVASEDEDGDAVKADQRWRAYRAAL